MTVASEANAFLPYFHYSKVLPSASPVGSLSRVHGKAWRAGATPCANLPA